MYRNRKEGYELQPQHYIPTLTDEWFQFLHRSYNPNDRVTTPSNEKKKCQRISGIPHIWSKDFKEVVSDCIILAPSTANYVTTVLDTSKLIISLRHHWLRRGGKLNATKEWYLFWFDNCKLNGQKWWRLYKCGQPSVYQEFHLLYLDFTLLSLFCKIVHKQRKS